MEFSASWGIWDNSNNYFGKLDGCAVEAYVYDKNNVQIGYHIHEYISCNKGSYYEAINFELSGGQYVIVKFTVPDGVNSGSSLKFDIMNIGYSAVSISETFGTIA